MCWKRRFRPVSVVLLVVAALVAGATPGFAGRKRPGPPGNHLTIQTVLIDMATGPNGQLIVRGKDFDFGGPLTVTIGDISAPLNVVFSSPEMIVVDLPPGPPLAGDHLLTVSTGKGQSRNDEYDLTFGLEGPQGPQGPPGPAGPQGPPGVTDAGGLVFYETEPVSLVIPQGKFSITQTVSCDNGDIILSPASMGIANHAFPSFDLNSWSWERTSSSTIVFSGGTFDTCNESIGCILAFDLRGLCLDATP